MNEAQVRAVEHMNGWEAFFRKVHRSAWEPVQVNGIAQLFASEELAKIAAYEALHRHLFGDGIVSSGEKISLARAEKEFAALYRKGKKIVVERRS